MFVSTTMHQIACKLSSLQNMKLDFHCHSHYSDGTLSPWALMARAKENKLTAWALTDHDTTQGVEVLLSSHHRQQDEPIFVPGVEISASFKGRTLHILGLNIDVAHPRLQRLLARQTALRYERQQWFCQQLQRYWPEVTWFALFDQIIGDGVPCRSHIAKAMVQAGLATSVGQAFDKWLAKGKRLAYQTPWASAEEVISVVKEAGGFAGLAHPTRYRFSNSRLTVCIEELARAGLDFLELAYPSIQSSQQRWLVRVCQRLGLTASIGSDFHGPEQSWNELGKCHYSSAQIPLWCVGVDFQNC